MVRDIALMFYEHGGYESSSAKSEQTNYIELDDVTSTYIPQAVLRLNAICNISRSVAYDTGSISSGNPMDDVILAELALSIADSEYDKLHIDPDTGAMENKHYTVAKQYMLDMYGTSYKGEIVLPNQVESNKAYFDMYISTMSV
jgi:hypothetical protein